MNYTYPKNYKNKPVTEQLKTLKAIFPEIKNTKGEIDLATEIETEGQFIIPNPKLFGTYNEAVAKVLEALKSSRTCYDWREGKWGIEYLKQLPVKEQFWSKQEDMIVISAQFGQQHAGESVKTVRESTQDNELPFGVYEVGIMLLTHPERLQSYDDLFIDCPGDEYSYSGDGVFSKAPIFNFYGGELLFGTYVVSDARDNYGSASGFGPQALETRPLDTSCSLETSATETLDDVAEHEAIALLKDRGFKITKEKVIIEEF